MDTAEIALALVVIQGITQVILLVVVARHAKILKNVIGGVQLLHHRTAKMMERWRFR